MIKIKPEPISLQLWIVSTLTVKFSSDNNNATTNNSISNQETSQILLIMTKTQAKISVDAWIVKKELTPRSVVT